MDLCFINTRKLRLLTKRDKPLLNFELVGAQNNGNGTILEYYLLNKKHQVMLARQADDSSSSEENVALMMKMMIEAIASREEWVKKYM